LKWASVGSFGNSAGGHRLISGAGFSSILLVEQNVEMATTLATRHYVIDQGRIVFEGTTAELQGRADVWERYFVLGVDGY